MLQITILLENLVQQRGLTAEHGLSLWLNCNGYNVLFDAGQSDLFYHNALNLGIDLSQTDRIVLSHGHYDHGDGFRFFPHNAAGGWPRFYAHPAVFQSRFSTNKTGERKSVGLAWQPDQLPGLQKHLMLHTGIMTIAPETWVCTHICDQVDDQQPTPGFEIEQNGQLEADRFCDEQILISRQKQGLVIVTGCSHPGLINILQCAHRLFPGDRIHALIGGFHLAALSDQELMGIANALKAFSFDLIVPLHCSGLSGRCALHSAFPDRCLLLKTGDSLAFS